MRKRLAVTPEISQRIEGSVASACRLFGSVTRPNAFHARSDLDIAFIEEPKKHSRYLLQAKIEEMIHHPVDLIILSEWRFREKIEREGELWTS